jgi:hypothetical protein
MIIASKGVAGVTGAAPGRRDDEAEEPNMVVASRS